MKKTPQKLVLRIQTLRVLNNIDLVRAVGGDSGNTRLADSGDVDCTTSIAAAACALTR
jgi:hypothetical protein